MRIEIKSAGKKAIKLRIPTALLFNNLTAKIALESLKEHIKVEENPSLSPEDIKLIIKELRRMKEKYPKLQLVDIESAEGDIVKIIL